jgi:DNA-binding NarL/FixJ family response regulator
MGGGLRHNVASIMLRLHRVSGARASTRRCVHPGELNAYGKRAAASTNSGEETLSMVGTHVVDESPPGDRGAGSHIRLLVVHPERLIGEALALALGGDPALAIIGVETRPREAVARALGAQPDVGILTDALPMRHLTECIAELRAVAVALKPLLLVTRVDGELIAACVRAGVVACLRTDQSIEVLRQATKQAHAGEMLLPPGILADELRGLPRTPARPVLGPREVAVLQVLATGARAQRAAAELSITVHTLRTHLRNAMAKLGAHSKVGAIILALRAGLIEVPRVPPGGVPPDCGGAPDP